MKRDRLEAILHRFPQLRIAVIGDLFLDKWLEIDRSKDELSVETGLTAWQVVKVRCYAGAAGTVLSDLKELGVGELSLISFIGDDGEGFEVRRILEKMGIRTEYLFVCPEALTPTYTKPVFNWADGQRMENNRLDFRNGPTPRELEDRFIAALEELAPRVDAIIVLDQIEDESAGVITPRVREAVSELAVRWPELLIYADSRYYTKEFRNIIVKCNDIEVVRMFRPEENERLPLDEVGECLRLLSEHSGRRAFVTCGEKGILVQPDEGKCVLVPTIRQEGEIDIVGAGDACTSGIVSALCAGASQQEAAEVGNLVSSITIQVIGSTGTASREQVLARWDEYYGA